MATISEWLNRLGFDWTSGHIIIQNYPQDPSETENLRGSHWIVSATSIANDDHVLDVEFDDGFGSHECPRFIAKDSKAIYFPCQYDGATWAEKVFLDISQYLDTSNPTPYPGG